MTGQLHQVILDNSHVLKIQAVNECQKRLIKALQSLLYTSYMGGISRAFFASNAA
jgi:hypothetical protein